MSNARLGECDFVTDRGPKRFAAWQMESEDALGPIWVLDPIIVARAWSPPEPPSRPRPFAGSPRRALAATASSDDYTITLTFVGGLPERIDYPSADVVETRTAVVILPRPTHREPIEAGGWVPAVGTTRTVTVDLGDPLGSRVLTDIDGPPVPVTSIR